MWIRRGLFLSDQTGGTPSETSGSFPCYPTNTCGLQRDSTWRYVDTNISTFVHLIFVHLTQSLHSATCESDLGHSSRYLGTGPCYSYRYFWTRNGSLLPTLLDLTGDSSPNLVQPTGRTSADTMEPVGIKGIDTCPPDRDYSYRYL